MLCRFVYTRNQSCTRHPIAHTRARNRYTTGLFIFISSMDKKTTSAALSSKQRPEAALTGNWTTDAPSWTPSKATALLPTSLPVSKPHRGWDRVPNPPVAQHSRVKQVWRRQCGLKSQPNSEEKEWQQQERTPSSTRQRSPARILKKKRVRSPSVKTAKMKDEESDEQNHAPTRWERWRSGVRREFYYRLEL